ncbi:MAG: hypothetical protein AVDCRST_MAG12-2535 [uncultured Rubrobacteraceae bacterium]|uniref:Uncharacterized protein n=1 Tax=uncultured Rubrobacteraceae bacterium TaxID=349277 RepID=A0A6J4SP87_9ACTN|nr:MAG: hypothetical protein AVDCRST_MAG12-2535 [uncultured Rubrobacteraceae bacterium]
MSGEGRRRSKQTMAYPRRAVLAVRGSGRVVGFEGRRGRSRGPGRVSRRVPREEGPSGLTGGSIRDAKGRQE